MLDSMAAGTSLGLINLLGAVGRMPPLIAPLEGTVWIGLGLAMRISRKSATDFRLTSVAELTLLEPIPILELSLFCGGLEWLFEE